MKRILSVVFVILLISCTSEVDHPSLLGKWAGVDDREYYEMHIDSSKIYVYNLWGMNISYPIRYSVEGDSLFYEDLGYSVGYSYLNDTMLFLSAPESCDTLYRLSSSTVTFNEVDIKDSIALRDFYEAVWDRAMSMYAMSGIELNSFEGHLDSIEEFEIEMQKSTTPNIR